jgi:hypothetical protein
MEELKLFVLGATDEVHERLTVERSGLAVAKRKGTNGKTNRQ